VTALAAFGTLPGHPAANAEVATTTTYTAASSSPPALTASATSVAAGASFLRLCPRRIIKRSYTSRKYLFNGDAGCFVNQRVSRPSGRVHDFCHQPIREILNGHCGRRK
jgi:hypothetical protein